MTMKKNFFDKASMFILIFLALLVLLQIGTLWNFQNRGVPFPFLTARKTVEVKKKIQAKDFFTPYQILVLKGYDEPNDVFLKDDPAFEALWEVLRFNVREMILENAAFEEVAYTDEAWGAILKKNVILAKFYEALPKDLWLSFLQVKEIKTLPFSEISKIALVVEQEKSNTISLWITDEQAMYQYPLIREIEALMDWFVMDEQSRPISAKLGARLLQEVFPVRENAPFLFEPDISVDLIGEKKVQLPKINVTTPSWILEGKRDLDTVEKAAADTLGADRYSYHADIDERGNIVLGNINHLYRIDSSGILEYTYLGDTRSSVEVNYEAALETSVEFINNRNRYTAASNLQLSKIRHHPETGFYTVAFEYEIADAMFLFQSEEKAVIPFIEIETDGQNVIRSRMFIRKIEELEESDAYTMSFQDFSTALFRKVSPQRLKTTHIKEIFWGYVVPLNQEVMISPEFVFKTPENVLMPLGYVETGGKNAVE